MAVAPAHAAGARMSAPARAGAVPAQRYTVAATTIFSTRSAH
ncbi:hypothetical protein GLE_4683 [Lysobacter enzymogenes]|uniref:Uncharacterized protein n=1 Tax=Lysobacter enzymogenes TaxID=69 RepID=A0A0S2DPD8_LYSEN|nr:hypothetical protein GLE_4683 [Lysobacter enzymogenes]